MVSAVAPRPFQSRKPQGVPGGGRWARKDHAEADGVVLSNPDAVPLPVLRQRAMEAVGSAIEELESHNMKSLRHSYRAFPTASFGTALGSLRQMRAQLCGEPPPMYRTGADISLAEYRTRTTFIPGRRPIAEIRAEAADQIDQVVGRLDDPVVVECSSADRSFPTNAYSKALASLRTVRDQIHAGVPPKVPAQVAEAWSGLTIKGPGMGVYQRRLDIAIAKRDDARRQTPRIAPEPTAFRGPHMGVYRDRLLAAIAERDAARREAGHPAESTADLPFSDR